MYINLEKVDMKTILSNNKYKTYNCSEEIRTQLIGHTLCWVRKATLMLFYRKILYYRVCSLIEIDYVQINLGFTQLQFDDWPLIHKKQNFPENALPKVEELLELSDPLGVRILPIVTSRSEEMTEEMCWSWEWMGWSREWLSWSRVLKVNLT
jgi:hypothetical protein